MVMAAGAVNVFRFKKQVRIQEVWTLGAEKGSASSWWQRRCVIDLEVCDCVRD